MKFPQSYKPLAVLLLCVSFSSGCTSCLAPIDGVSVDCVPQHCLGVPRSDWEFVPFGLLRMQRPKQYRVAAGDILGIYVEGVLPRKNGPADISQLPVHFPEGDSDLPPSVGHPIPVRDDGRLPLPLLDPLPVDGMTLTEVEELIKKEYVSNNILRKGQERVLVSIMKERTIRVLVVREDTSGGGELVRGTSRRGEGHTLDMPAYKNDLMHALTETGGLPGLSAKNQVTIFKGARLSEGEEDTDFQTLLSQGIQMDPSSNLVGAEELIEDPFRKTIPLRVPPGTVPSFRRSDVILEEGDIVFVESRDNEFYYTGGLLPPGQFPLPRDYDLDVLGALAIAGAGADGTSTQSQGALLGGFTTAAPTQLYIKRKTPYCPNLTIEVDLKQAFNNPRYNILIQPGDTLILRHKPCEEALNFGIASFFTFGIRELFR